MYVTNIKPEAIESAYRRQYPTFRTIRIRNTNLDKIKKRAIKYGESVDDIVTHLLSQLEYYEHLGYETPKEGSF